jgi:branched-chain amino acid transport system ATP-binding protein
MLKVKSVATYYNNIRALNNVSLHISAGEIVSLIGSNGAGKTTMLNTVSGLIPPREGEIFFDDQDIVGLPPEKIVEMGISQVPEGRKLFTSLSVMDNLILGGYPYLRKENNQKKAQDDLNYIFHLFPVLAQRKPQLAGTLSGGEQQMLAIGRALMARPRLLLLDEPSMGLAPLLVKEIFRVIQQLRQAGTAILLVEQNARSALQICDRAYVLETGRIILEGPPGELLENQLVKNAYLGREYREVWE